MRRVDASTNAPRGLLGVLKKDGTDFIDIPLPEGKGILYGRPKDGSFLADVL
jgi:hypothetical protein